VSLSLEPRWDLQRGVQTLDAWWRAQVTALEALRETPVLGRGPGTASPGTCALVGFVSEHGWLGYVLLALCAFRIGLDRLGSPALVLLGVLGLVAASDGATLLRLAPIAGLVLARALGMAGRRRPRQAWLRSRWGRVPAATVAATVVAGGLAQGSADFLVSVGDASQRRLEWATAANFYRKSTQVAVDPSLGLERLSDPLFREARYRDGIGMEAAAEPLLELVALGLDTGWTWYRLSEIAAFSGTAPDKVLAFALQAVEKAPGSPSMRVALGHRWLALRRLEPAADVFRQAIRLESALLPRLFRDVRRVTTNASVLRRLLPPGDLDLHLQLARLLEQSGLIPAALLELETLLSRGGASVRAHLELAGLLARSGRTSMAIAELRELARWTSLGPRDRQQILAQLAALEPPKD
jgi:tetratricopeptide (TPR) repeat protein